MSDESSKDCCDHQVLRARLDAVAQAQKRSRAAFLASTVACVALMVAAWNAYSSSYRAFMSNRSFSHEEVTREAQKTLVDEWVRSLKVSIPILGIQASVGDGAILGSISLCVICVWIFLSMRRENHMVGALLRDTKNCEANARTMVFDAIVSISLFPIVNIRDDAIVDLDQEPRKKRFSLILGSHKVLILLPAITVLLLFIADWMSIWVLSSPFQDSSLPVRQLMTSGDWIRQVIIDGLCLLLLLVIMRLCVTIMKYADATLGILMQYQELSRQY